MSLPHATDGPLTREAKASQIRPRARKIKYLSFFLLAALLGIGVVGIKFSPADVPAAVQLAGPNDIVAPNSRTGMVYGIAISPDNQTLAAGDDASNLKLWNMKTGELRQVITGHKGTIHAVVFSEDGTTLVSGSTIYAAKGGYLDGGEVKVWNAINGKLIRSLSWPDYYVRNVALSGDGRTIAVGGARTAGDKIGLEVEMYDVQTGELLHRLTQRGDAQYDIDSLVFSPDGKWIVTSMRDGIRIWDAKTGKLGHHLLHQGGLLPQPIAVSPDSKLLATSYASVIEMYDLATGDSTAKYQLSGQVIYQGLDQLTFLSDTQLLGKSPFDLYSWELKPNGARTILRGYSLGEVVISRDGQRMAGKNGNALMMQEIDWTAAKIVSD